jgi:beta-glucanase (GH16 family)
MRSSGHLALPRPARRWTTTRRLLCAAATALLATTAFVEASAQASAPPPPSGWSVAFLDDFDGPSGSLPSGGNWTFDLGHSYPGGPANWGTGEIQNYTNSTNNISLDGGGNLRITAHRDGGGNWTSARIETNRADFKAPDGGAMRMEARIQMPNVTGAEAEGYWPAFWALGSPYRGNYWNWPGIGEFDIMENVNGINAVWGVLHCGVAPGGPCNENNGIGTNRACPGASCQSAFHTYTFEWDRSVSPNQLRWFVDGQQFHTVSQGQLPADTWNNMTNHAGYFILLNLAMGGAFPNGVAGKGTPTPATASGRSLVVDYVTVLTRSGGGGGGAAKPLYGLNKCVDVQAANSNDGTPITIYDCNNTPAQQWTRVGETFQAYGKCLDIFDNSTANGAPIILWTCTNGGNQRWQFGANNSLYNPQSNRCLDIPGGDTTNGRQLVIWDCNGGDNQRFYHG